MKVEDLRSKEALEAKLEADGEVEMHELLDLMGVWAKRGDNDVATLFMLIGMGVRGLRLVTEQMHQPRDLVRDEMLAEVKALWEMSHEEMALATRRFGRTQGKE